MRQGRKAVTLITGFELFGLDAEELAEELRKLCSSSTTGMFTLKTIVNNAHIDTSVYSCTSSRQIIWLGSDGPRKTDESGLNTLDLERRS